MAGAVYSGAGAVVFGAARFSRHARAGNRRGGINADLAGDGVGRCLSRDAKDPVFPAIAIAFADAWDRGGGFYSRGVGARASAAGNADFSPAGFNNRERTG